MSISTMERRVAGPEDLQRRIHALGRAALEGGRPLSDLLGEALSELRMALASVRTLQEELARREARPVVFAEPGPQPPRPAVHRSPEAVPDRAGVGAGAPVAAVAALVPLPPPEEECPGRARELLRGPVPHTAGDLETSLRARIAGALYLGTLRAGDRLPGIREMSRATGLNHKVVGRVCRSLERAGLLEVRDRSGIYAAAPEPPVAGDPSPVEAWVARVVVEALQLGLGARDLPALLERSIGASPLRCACVDSAEDDRFALCEEIGARFGLQTVPVDTRSAEAQAALRAADVVVTTPFHADAVRRSLAPGQPLVIACLHPAWRQRVEAHSGDAPLRLVCVESEAGERLRDGFGPELAGRVRVVRVDELDGAAGDGSGAPELATRAAWASLGDAARPRDMAVPEYLSTRAARDLAEVVVKLHRPAQAAPVA